MARTYTLSDLVQRCQQRCDQESDSRITEWKALISEMYGELCSVVSETGLRYFESESTITATGAASYTEPADLLSLVSIEFVVDSAGRRRALREVPSQEHAMYRGLTGDAYQYAWIDDQIFLLPTPSSGTYKVLYIPQPPDLSTSTDVTSVDVVTPDGEAFLIWGVVAKAKAKSEADVSQAMAEREAARQRLTDWAAMRVFHNARRRMVDDSDYLLSGFDPADWRWRP